MKLKPFKQVLFGQFAHYVFNLDVIAIQFLKCLWCKNNFPQQSQAVDDYVKYERVGLARETKYECNVHMILW
jgi:hypothetical protein